MQKARGHPSDCSERLPQLVSIRFQVLFHSLVQGAFHLSLTVLVHYRSLRSIQPYQMVLANSNGASPTPPYSGYYLSMISYTYRALTFFGLLSHAVQFHITSIMQSYNPSLALTSQVWAVARSLATTCAITKLFSLPPGTQMFQVSGFAPHLAVGDIPSVYRVAPFGHLRINSYLPIPAAFRSLSRPSSPLRAQAFPIRSYLLLLIFTTYLCARVNDVSLHH